MLYVLLVAALVAINIGYLLAGDRKDKRERDERADLLQRIQAPQAAVVAHHAARVGPTEETDGMPMSDEEIAEQQERARAISMIEAFENGRLGVLDGTFE